MIVVSLKASRTKETKPYATLEIGSKMCSDIFDESKLVQRIESFGTTKNITK